MSKLAAAGTCGGGGESAAQKPQARMEQVRLLHLPGLVAIIFYSVCGGPFGSEDIISAAGPFYSLLGFLVMPLVWSLPEALVTAELSTAFPQNGGYVIWVTAAFGPFWGFMEGFLGWLVASVDTAVYPVLLSDYVRHIWPGVPRDLFVLGSALVLTTLNATGVQATGWGAFVLAAFTISPFLYMSVVGLPQVEPENLLFRPEISDIDWPSYFNVLFWNLNYWDSASQLAGEVRDPSRDYPRGLGIAMVLVFLTYALPVLLAVGLPDDGQGTDWQSFTDGSYATLGRRIGGPIVGAWVVAAAATSNVGQFVSEQTASAYQLQGMSELGYLPACLAWRSSRGVPFLTLALGLVVTLIFCLQGFQQIIDLLNGVYCLGQILEFISFLWLRHKRPELPRPYKMPLRSTGACVAGMTIPIVFASGMVLMPIYTQDWGQLSCFIGAPIVGYVLYHFLELCRRRGWLRYMRDPPTGFEECVEATRRGGGEEVGSDDGHEVAESHVSTDTANSQESAEDQEPECRATDGVAACC